MRYPTELAGVQIEVLSKRESVYNKGAILISVTMEDGCSVASRVEMSRSSEQSKEKFDE